MAAQEYEYLAVQLGLVPNEKKMTGKINSVAADGWRLIHVTHTNLGPNQLIFERRLN